MSNIHKPSSLKTIPELVEYLVHKFGMNTIPSPDTPRNLLERHYGRAEVIQHIVNHCSISELDLKDDTLDTVAPISISNRDSNDNTLDNTNSDPIEDMLHNENYFE